MNIKIPAYIVCIILIIVLQTTVVEYIAIQGIKPNLLVIFIISIALLRGSAEGAVVGLAAGMAMDMAAGKIIGLYAFIGLYIGLFIGFMNKKIYRENYLIVLFVTFVFTSVIETLVYFVINLTNGQIYWLNAFGKFITPTALYNSVLSVVIYLMAIKLSRWFEETDRIRRKY